MPLILFVWSFPARVGCALVCPNGKQLTATLGDSVWIIDPDTGDRHLAVQFPQGFVTFFRAAWTPDGKSVIVNRQQRLSQIVLLENFWTP